MNKKEFLKLLESKLQVLEEKEIKDIIEEYDNHIEEKMKDGKSEEEAISDFGNIDDLVDEILSAYKINTKKVRGENNASNFFNTLVDEMVNFCKKVVKSFEGKRGDDLIRIICKFILVLILISILRIPFEIIKDLGSNIFNSLPWFLDNLMSGLWMFTVELAYFVLAIGTIYVTVKNIVFDEEVVIDADKIKNKAKQHKSEEGKNMKETKEENKVIYKEDIDTKDNVKYKEDINKEDNVKYKEDNKTNREGIVYKEGNNTTVLSPVVVIFKIFIILFTLPGLFMLFGLIVTLGVMIALCFQGIYLISLFFIIIGSIMITSALLGMVYHIVFPKGGRK